MKSNPFVRPKGAHTQYILIARRGGPGAPDSKRRALAFATGWYGIKPLPPRELAEKFFNDAQEDSRHLGRIDSLNEEGRAQLRTQYPY